MELLKDENQKNVSLSTQENECDNENETIDLSEENLYDSFKDRFKSDYEDDF